jgi:anti-sigma B factor antagonist
MLKQHGSLMFLVERRPRASGIPSVKGLDMTTLRIGTELPNDGRAVLRLTGELDLVSCDELDAALRGLELNGRPNITLDLSGLTFMDSTGLRPIVQAEHRARTTGGSLLVRDGPKQIEHVLDLTGMRDELTFTP